MQGGELAALRGATEVLIHIELVTLSLAGAADPIGERHAIDAHLSRHGFFRTPLRGPGHDTSDTLVYVRKERLWQVDPLAMIRRVLQGANVALCCVGWHGNVAEAALRESPSLRDQTAFCGLRLTALTIQGPAAARSYANLEDMDVLVSYHDGLPAFQTLLTAALQASRLCAIVVWGMLPAPDVESATRVAFDHGFLLDRESASGESIVFLRSSVIGDPARWLAANNAFGRRDFRFSALGEMGRFGNQL